MSKIDPALAIKPIQALHYIVWVTRADDQSLVGGVARTFTPRNQCGHGPQPGSLSVIESFGTRDETGLPLMFGMDLAGGVGHIGDPSEIKRELRALKITIGCMQWQANMAIFLFHPVAIPRIIV
jgi:hypothetical protein